MDISGAIRIHWLTLCFGAAYLGAIVCIIGDIPCRRCVYRSCGLRTAVGVTAAAADGFCWNGYAPIYLPDSLGCRRLFTNSRQSACGFAPVLGINGVTFALTLSAALITFAILPNVVGRRRLGALAAAAAIFIGGGFLHHLWQWTTPVGKTTVSLLQGNVEQNLKWRKGQVTKALTDYLDMAEKSSGKIIILPETALPMRLSDLPTGYIQALKNTAASRNGAVVTGVFLEDDETSDQGADNGLQALYNGVAAFGDFPAGLLS